jgi:hypothetical protein
MANAADSKSYSHYRAALLAIMRPYETRGFRCGRIARQDNEKCQTRGTLQRCCNANYNACNATVTEHPGPGPRT